MWHALAQLVDALREGREFDSRWCHWNWQSSRPHFGPEADSASNRSEYQEYFLGDRGGWCLGLTLPFSCADCLEICEPQIPGTFRAVTGLLTGHNTLRRHLHLLGLLDSPLCTKCGVGKETSAHILCECEALASLIPAYLGSFFLEPKGIRSLGLGAIWSYSKVAGLP